MRIQHYSPRSLLFIRKGDKLVSESHHKLDDAESAAE
jgi:hypothetical protein